MNGDEFDPNNQFVDFDKDSPAKKPIPPMPPKMVEILMNNPELHKHPLVIRFLGRWAERGKHSGLLNDNDMMADLINVLWNAKTQPMQGTNKPPSYTKVSPEVDEPTKPMPGLISVEQMEQHIAALSRQQSQLAQPHPMDEAPRAYDGYAEGNDNDGPTNEHHPSAYTKVRKPVVMKEDSQQERIAKVKLALKIINLDQQCRADKMMHFSMAQMCVKTSNEMEVFIELECHPDHNGGNIPSVKMLQDEALDILVREICR
jgi:hypothetical protein